MKSYELLREGEWTTDGRRILPGALSWPDDPLPVVGRSADGMDTAEVIGSVTNIRREGDRIWGDTDVELPEGKRLTCAIDIFKMAVPEGEDPTTGRPEVIHGRLSVTHVSDESAYPWKDD